MSDERQWSNRKILRSIKNPSDYAYEIELETQEFTFDGAHGQPDFGELHVTYVPHELVIELKSLKNYVRQFRNTVISYERLINVIYKDLWEIYNPSRLQITMTLRTRGGFNSRLKIDSSNRVRFERETPEEDLPDRNPDRCSPR